MKFFSDTAQNPADPSPELTELLLTRFSIAKINAATKFIKKTPLKNETESDLIILQHIRKNYPGPQDIESIIAIFSHIIAIKKLIQEACVHQWGLEGAASIRPEHVLAMAKEVFGSEITQNQISQKIKEKIDHSTSEILTSLNHVGIINLDELKHQLTARFPFIDQKKLSDSVNNLNQAIDRLSYNLVNNTTYPLNTDEAIHGVSLFSRCTIS